MRVREEEKEEMWRNHYLARGKKNDIYPSLPPSLPSSFSLFRETGHQVMQERPAETAALIIAAATKWSRARRRAGRKEGRREKTVLVEKMGEEEEVPSPQRIAKEEEGEEEEEDKIAILR